LKFHKNDRITLDKVLESQLGSRRETAFTETALSKKPIARLISGIGILVS
jgi:hypothetical protein